MSRRCGEFSTATSGRSSPPPFAIGVAVFTFFLFIDRIYQLTNLVITKNVPFHLVISLLVFMLPAFLSLTLPMAMLVAVLLVCGRLAGDLEVSALEGGRREPAAPVPPVRRGRHARDAPDRLAHAVRRPPGRSGAFQQQLFRILQTRAATAITERTFSAAFGHYVIYVEEISPSQLALRGLLVSDERDPQRSRLIVAREGRLLTDEDEPAGHAALPRRRDQRDGARRPAPLPPHRVHASTT